MNTLNSIDRELIQLLEKDASQTSAALARQLSVSPATVRRRLKRLTQSGVLRITALVDPDKMGTPIIAIIAMNLMRDKLESATQLLASKPEIKFLSTTTGRFDIMICTWFHSTKELTNFVQKDLAQLPGLKDTETFICLQVIKGRYIPYVGV